MTRNAGFTFTIGADPEPFADFEHDVHTASTWTVHLRCTGTAGAATKAGQLVQARLRGLTGYMVGGDSFEQWAEPVRTPHVAGWYVVIAYEDDVLLPMTRVGPFMNRDTAQNQMDYSLTIRDMLENPGDRIVVGCGLKHYLFDDEPEHTALHVYFTTPDPDIDQAWVMAEEIAGKVGITSTTDWALSTAGDWAELVGEGTPNPRYRSEARRDWDRLTRTPASRTVFDDALREIAALAEYDRGQEIAVDDTSLTKYLDAIKAEIAQFTGDRTREQWRQTVERLDTRVQQFRTRLDYS